VAGGADLCTKKKRKKKKKKSLVLNMPAVGPAASLLFLPRYLNIGSRSYILLHA
jgi:hypothetical protein